ncbi:MAG: S-adenosylmethionine:tRNA ribosyltransferase-isomerase, partial [Gemmatimonadetes bacterium]|nr:S-adenosylmethionine:tRNA ribosyltransferase-isomerase [Gemmatimonadota bacterium]
MPLNAAHLTAADFDFELPEDLIAQAPLGERAASRLLHVPPAGPVAHRSFTELPDLLRSGDLLVLNETRVIPARLALVRETGGAVEALLTRPAPGGGWGAM